jgi:thiol-disulfide isomerase/thioredoxin
MIQRFILLLLILLQAFCTGAQTAPNFMVTDSWGNTHRLYEDYLDQGKTVVVKVFYVACPPCNAIAPYLEPLYQSWGGGNADVQFIELSTKQTDTDALINGYKNNHNTSFPACGSQGGSVAAVTPYTTGVFGVFTGTPTFVVIAPDKTVNYDVSGFNIQGTIDALDAAIEATGATGTITALSGPESNIPLAITSTVVGDLLTLHYQGDPTELNTTIISVTGQKYTSLRFPAEKNEPVRINVSGLSQGTWILNVNDVTSGNVASYLFIKQ